MSSTPVDFEESRLTSISEIVSSEQSSFPETPEGQDWSDNRGD